MEKNKTFALDVRILVCKHCGAPLSVPSQGGNVKCEYCDFVNHVAPRPKDKSAGAPQGASLSSANLSPNDRLIHLRRQESAYAQTDNPYSLSKPPAGLEKISDLLIRTGRVDPSVTDTVQEEFNHTVEECENNPADAGAEHRCYWLALELNQLWHAQKEPLRQRAVLENAMEVISEPGFNYIIRTCLARAALSLGDRFWAQKWLSQCDPAPDNLDQDSAYRISAASLALAQKVWDQALNLVGSVPNEIPFEPTSRALSEMIRVAAYEGMGNGAAAEKWLRELISKYGEKKSGRMLKVNNFLKQAKKTWSRHKSGHSLPHYPSSIASSPSPTGSSPDSQKQGKGKVSGCLTVLVLGALIALPIIFSPLLCTGMGSCMGYHQPAMDRLQSCPAAVQALGEPIEAAYIGFSCGNSETGGGSGYANWRMPVKGSRASGAYEFSAVQSGGRWSVQSGRVTVDGNTIDLQNCHIQQVYPPGAGGGFQVPGAVPNVQTPTVPPAPGACARMGSCCAVVGNVEQIRPMCQSIDQVRHTPVGEQVCSQQIQSARAILSAMGQAIPAQCQ